MGEQTVIYGLYGSIAFASLSIFGVFCLLTKEPTSKQVVLRTYRELTGLVKRNRRLQGWYQGKSAWLVKNGASYHLGRKLEPMRFLILRTLCGAAGFFLGAMTLGAVGGILGIAFFFLPDGLIWYLNGRDNEALLPEIKLVYHGLEQQIRAGVYISDALAEMYSCAQNVRLQEALLALAGDFVMKADFVESLNHFQEKFDNRYVDSLCIILLQALESGQAVELLGDIGEQLKDMEAIALARKKNALERRVTFYQLGILAVVLGVSLYACVTHMMSAASLF